MKLGGIEKFLRVGSQIAARHSEGLAEATGQEIFAYSSVLLKCGTVKKHPDTLRTSPGGMTTSRGGALIIDYSGCFFF